MVSSLTHPSSLWTPLDTRKCGVPRLPPRVGEALESRGYLPASPASQYLWEGADYVPTASHLPKAEDSRHEGTAGNKIEGGVGRARGSIRQRLVASPDQTVWYRAYCA